MAVFMYLHLKLGQQVLFIVYSLDKHAYTKKSFIDLFRRHQESRDQE